MILTTRGDYNYPHIDWHCKECRMVYCYTGYPPEMRCLDGHDAGWNLNLLNSLSTSTCLKCSSLTMESAAVRRRPWSRSNPSATVTDYTAEPDDVQSDACGLDADEVLIIDRDDLIEFIWPAAPPESYLPHTFDAEDTKHTDALIGLSISEIQQQLDPDVSADEILVGVPRRAA